MNCAIESYILIATCAPIWRYLNPWTEHRWRAGRFSGLPGWEKTLKICPNWCVFVCRGGISQTKLSVLALTIDTANHMSPQLPWRWWHNRREPLPSLWVPGEAARWLCFGWARRNHHEPCNCCLSSSEMAGRQLCGPRETAAVAVSHRKGSGAVALCADEKELLLPGLARRRGNLHCFPSPLSCYPIL